MMNAENLIERMKQHFADWMDIRKRTKRSDGGKLLIAVAEETAMIQEAIDAYKRDFFVDGYEGREESILTFVYKTPIGIVDLERLSVVSPALPLAESVRDFYGQTGYAYYEDGNLFFRTEDVQSESVQYKIDTYVSTGVLEKIHVWNVFDEFATFVGIERHQWETNTELQARILNVFRRRTNSTEVGIRNAILNELIHLDPSLQEEDVVVERPTPENLVKHYKEFESVIEYLANINRDVYRTKRWDLDTWNYAFKSVDYIPHAWDIMLDYYQNGVGDHDQLSASTINPNASTNARVTFYAKSSASVEEYVRKQNVKQKIGLSLTRYSNVLKPVVARYRIAASEVKDITGDNLSIECYSKSAGDETRYIAEVASADLKDIETVDRGMLPDEKRYKLAFRPKADYGPMTIQQANVTQGTQTLNLLKEKPGYLFKADGSLSNRTSLWYGGKKKDFTSSVNALDSVSGITIDDLANEAVLKLSLSGLSNEMLTFKSSCTPEDLPAKDIVSYGFEKSGFDTLQSITSYEDDKYVEITTTANQVTFDVTEGNYAIATSINGGPSTPVLYSGLTGYTTAAFDFPTMFTIRITPTDRSRVTIKQFKRTFYEMAVSLKYGSLALIAGNYYLPNDGDNELTITLKAKNAYAPVLNFAYVGAKLTGAVYETDPIEIGSARKLNVQTDCWIDLIEIDANGAEITRTPNYEPFREYVGLTDNAYVKLDMSQYSAVNSLRATVGRFESIGGGTGISYYLRLRKGERALKLTINGERLTSSKVLYINDLIGADPAAGDRVYITSLFRGFAIDRNGVQRLVPLKMNSHVELARSESFKVNGLSSEMESTFVISNVDDSKLVTKSYSGVFDSVFVSLKAPTTYIAYNESRMVTKELNNIEIVNVFQPFLSENKLMAYRLESMDESGKVLVAFESAEVDFLKLNKWAIGRKPIRINSGISMSDTLAYELSENSFEQEFSIGEMIPLNRTYTLSNGEIIELPKYLIGLPSQMELVYRKRKASDTIESAPEFYSSESFLKESDGFNKLTYANLDEIIYLGTTPWTGTNPSMDTSMYSVMKNEGIIVWNNDTIPAGQVMYMVYTIKIPDYIKVSLDAVYSMIAYNIDAYRELGHVDIRSKKNGDTYDMRANVDYKLSNKVTVFCDQAGFTTEINNGVLTFKQQGAANVVAVKTGYYYSDGQEYYQFANETADEIDNTSNVEFSNVTRDEGQMQLKKRSKNFVRNSYMDLGPIANIHSRNFARGDVVQGVSRLNAITACNSFNNWETFGGTLSLAPAYNGIGLNFVQTSENGFAYVDITESLLPDTHISFYLKGDAKVYIGKERTHDAANVSVRFPRSVSIEPMIQATRSVIEPEMMETQFTPEADRKYYLILVGTGLIDDIILRDGKTVSVVRGSHQKNLSILNLTVEEKIATDYTSRLFIGDNQKVKSQGAEVAADGSIVNSSTVDWGITKVKEFGDPTSWSRCVFKNVNLSNGVCSTRTGVPGSIETEAVFIGDRRTVQNVLFEINDVLLSNMTGFTVNLMMSDTLNGQYRKATSFKTNIGSVRGDFLLPYVKLLIEMPGGKIIHNIAMYIEYKSTSEAAPAEASISNGSLWTGVLDTHYPAKYRLSGIGIESISNINDVTLQIRGAKENANGEVWTPWKTIQLNTSLEIVGDISFDGYRFFQLSVSLRKRSAYVKLTHIDMGVI